MPKKKSKSSFNPQDVETVALEWIKAFRKAGATWEDEAKARAFCELSRRYDEYENKPGKYIREILRKKLYPKQIEICQALATRQKVLVRAAQYYGSSFLAGALTNWFFDSNIPSVTITIAPTEDSLNDILWKEVRLQRRGRPGLAERVPRLETSPEHYAQGYTAKDISNFEPRRERNLLVIFDKAHEIPIEFWEKAQSMITADNQKFVAFYNPRLEAKFIGTYEAQESFYTVECNAFSHPNIDAELKNFPPVVETSVRKRWLEHMLAEYTMSTPTPDKENNIEWPPASGNWFKPEAEFESQVLARWPKKSKDSGYNLNPAVVAPETANEIVPGDYESMIAETLQRAKDISSKER